MFMHMTVGWLDWNALPSADPEVRLSLLTRLVIDAEAAGQLFGLRLPGVEMPPMAGQGHFHRCLTVLATYEIDRAARAA